ncbi:Glycosyl transferase family 2 [Cohnella sp. OV330]|uniref:glycosyltransferase family 2 protein n=1 Tax=Cohnella sp. OV330 TaxID=1855288 RepID=UPI0008E58543|nr:glycosyltransferase [Cohnella sp. OV330]SFA93705.1 Glycosyl transferase family 2 [Cohnella sp. OV330]
MVRTTVVIPSFNRPERLMTCIHALRQHAGRETDIIVVATGSSSETASWCARSGIAYIALPGEVGFAEACNKGLRLAMTDTIVLLGEDWTVFPGWLPSLQDALGTGSRGGVAILPGSPEDAFNGTSAFEAYSGGACLAMRRQAMEKIGTLDPRFRSGAWAFADYALRAKLNGCDPKPARGPIVRRSDGAGYGDRDDPLGAIVLDRRTFAEKWSLESLAII